MDAGGFAGSPPGSAGHDTMNFIYHASQSPRRRLPPAPVLCSDTTVALSRTIYGKPADAKDAVRMLRELSGTTHRVLTAVAVQSGRSRREALSDSRVTFAT